MKRTALFGTMVTVGIGLFGCAGRGGVGVQAAGAGGGQYPGNVYTTAGQVPGDVYTTAGQVPGDVYTTGEGAYAEGALGVSDVKGKKPPKGAAVPWLLPASWGVPNPWAAPQGPQGKSAPQVGWPLPKGWEVPQGWALPWPSPSPGPGPGPSPQGKGNVPVPSPGAPAAVLFAQSRLGRPYCWGGTGPVCYDCSGLTSQSWKAGGKAIPRTSEAQVEKLPEVPLDKIVPGDILWRPGHVALYVGNGQIIHAPHTGDVVRYAPAVKFVKAVRP